MQRARSITLPFIRKEHLAQDTYSFFFDRRGIDFDFISGQYLRLTIPHAHPDDRGTSRYFTIASAPHDQSHVMITTKLYQSSFKETLHALQQGANVQLFGPMGTFILDDRDLSPRVFIAGGVGITPFYSMIRSIVQKKLAIPVTLIAIFTTEKEQFFVEELAALAKKQEMLHIIPHIAERDGRLTATHLQSYIGEEQKALFSVVGSSRMVLGIKEILHKLQIPKDRIITEDFTGY